MGDMPPIPYKPATMRPPPRPAPVRRKRLPALPHVWHTLDGDGGECRHLAMSVEGAVQAHLLHHGLMYYDNGLTATDEGPINNDTYRAALCFDPHCVLYGLSFPEDP